MTNSPEYQRTRREQRRARGVCIDCPRASGRYLRCVVCRHHKRVKESQRAVRQ